MYVQAKYKIFIENQTRIDMSCLMCVLCYISTGSGVLAVIHMNECVQS